MAARFLPLAVCASVLALGACRKVPVAGTPLPQRAYVWQREWTPDVAEKVREAGPRLDGLVVLGADVRGRMDRRECCDRRWTGPRFAKEGSPWESPCGSIPRRRE